MTEGFALFSKRLMPMFLTCNTTTLVRSTTSCTLSARYIDGTPVPEDLGVKEEVENMVEKLVQESAGRAKQNLVHGRGNWRVSSVHIPVRLLGAITWQYWERTDLEAAIQALERSRVRLKQESCFKYEVGCLLKQGKMNCGTTP